MVGEVRKIRLWYLIKYKPISKDKSSYLAKAGTRSYRFVDHRDDALRFTSLADAREVMEDITFVHRSTLSIVELEV